MCEEYNDYRKQPSKFWTEKRARWACIIVGSVGVVAFVIRPSMKATGLRMENRNLRLDNAHLSGQIEGMTQVMSQRSESKE